MNIQTGKMFITLRDGITFIGGHLFNKINSNNKYLVLEKDFRAGYKIKDDEDNFIWISKTAFNKYFMKIN